jgi:hypothetical protein
MFLRLFPWCGNAIHRIVRAGIEDPRIVRPPGGTISPSDPFYIERPPDALVRNRAIISGDTVTIKAARQMGKSSLLVRYLMACCSHGKRPCFVDFQQFTNDDLRDYMTFLSRLYESMLHYLGLDPKKEITFKSHSSFRIMSRIISSRRFRSECRSHSMKQIAY